MGSRFLFIKKTKQITQNLILPHIYFKNKLTFLALPAEKPSAKLSGNFV
jgi:hypothetical protein